MSFKAKVNHFRRTVMHGLTRGIGTNSINKLKNTNTELVIKNVLISRPNQRLGNTLLITPLIQEIVKTFPEAKIDLFVKGKVAPIVFQNYPQVDQIIELPKKPFKQLADYIGVWFKLRQKKYDLVINVEKSSSSGRLSTTFANATYKLYGDEFLKNEVDEDQIHYGKYPVYQFRKFVELFTKTEVTAPYPILNIQLTEEEITKGKETLASFFPDSNKKTIAFFTYATGEKCYPVTWWQSFYNLFYPKYAENYNLIEILPVENISMLEHKLPEFYSKDVREIAAVMYNCELLVAADSGMMHLSVAAPTKTIGLFKLTLPVKYCPYGKGNSYLMVTDDNQAGVLERMEETLHK
ncbi:glycosyltransferase family 9 protein [Flavobacterium agricola]|uniref:Glycosyltransferase family 9 protein n=1 Tax=Flavobacterium agricola TaxID=2870839 RepID=A0ABY6M4Q9_9FLAO|nr:glycosyltransferase family 9 protein [Flavobacterium agricola]UYW02198.1 glycosyltransferase family 9 protein [Flavobacterium agricola]